MPDVHITAASMIVPCGVGSAAVIEAATAASPPDIICELTDLDLPPGTPPFGCPLKDFSLAEYAPAIRTYIDRTSALALAGAKLTLDEACLLDPERRPSELGLAYATAWGCLDSMALFYAKLRGGNPRFAPALPFSHSLANSPSSLLAIEYDLRGHATTHSGGWTCGAQAIGAAADAIQLEAAAALLAGGSEALSSVLLRHHDARGELSPSGALTSGTGQTDDADGIVLGEGAAFVVLERPGLRERAPLARLAGWGAASGAAGRPAVRAAVQRAVDAAGIDPRQPGVILSAGSGLPELDAIERDELRQWATGFGAQPAVFPTARLTGFLSGAGGAFAVALGAHLLARQVRPSQLKLAQLKLAQLNLAESGPRVDEPVQFALISSLDPGGAAVALVLTRAQ